MKEEANFHIGLTGPNLFTEHGRKKHQVIVVNPNEVPILYLTGNCLGEKAVGFLVGIPSRFVEGDLARVVVKERPKNRIFHEHSN